MRAPMECAKGSFASISGRSAALSRLKVSMNGGLKAASTYYFSRKDGKPLMLAGIWQVAEYKGDKRTAFAILTEEPNELVAPYLDRMPLALADDKVAAWLDLANETPLDDNLLLDLSEFTVRPMDRAMNNVRQKNLAAIDPKAAAA
jgi:putative SOS response-associated peptidase YedK